jgi:lipoprotein-anchoring transpeptidase ErfK/SrfK
MIPAAPSSSSQRAPLASQTPAIDHVFYGHPSGSQAGLPAIPLTSKAASAPTAIATPAAASTAIAAISPPSPAKPAPQSSPAASADHGNEGLRLYLNDTRSANEDPLNWSVVATKSHHQIQVFYRRKLYGTYHAVFGRSRFGGAKQWEGDRRTPEGNYLIVSRHRSARFRWFLKINYPNAADEANFVQLKSEGDIPRGLREGGAVGIHGTDLPILNDGNVDWTTGCISVDNPAISELARLLPIGTLVVIKP